MSTLREIPPNVAYVLSGGGSGCRVKVSVELKISPQSVAVNYSASPTSPSRGSGVNVLPGPPASPDLGQLDLANEYMVNLAGLSRDSASEGQGRARRQTDDEKAEHVTVVHIHELGGYSYSDGEKCVRRTLRREHVTDTKSCIFMKLGGHSYTQFTPPDPTRKNSHVASGRCELGFTLMVLYASILHIQE